MNIIEREEARRAAEHRKMMEENPIYASLHQHAQKRASEEKRCDEIINSYGPYGYILPKGKEEPRKPTDEELQMQEILKNY